MKRIFTADAEFIHVQVSVLRDGADVVEIQHHFRGAQGEIEDWWIQLTTADARRLAKQLNKAARALDKAARS